tara:strand:- start:685 stop:1005 length:321 start_codon:yes stop_codon:yes gene_type:complete
MLDSQAIFKAYPDVNQVTETQAFKHDENGRAIDFTSELNQSLIDAARAEIDALNYQRSRTGEDGSTDTIYLSVEEQLDMQYWDAVNGTTNWKNHIAAVKSKYPKPS